MVTYRSHVAHLFCTAIDADVVLSLETRFSVHQVMPVCVSIIVRIRTVAVLFNLFCSIKRLLAYINICLVSQFSIFSRSCIFWQLSQSLPTYQTRVVHLALTRLTTLGSNQDDTVRSLRTIDSSRSSILQYRDRFDIVRIDVVHGRFNTIHNHHRIGNVESTCTTYTDSTVVGTWLTTTLSNSHTRKQTLQTGRNRSNRTAFDQLVVHISYRTGQVSLLLSTVTYNNHFFQVHVVFLQDYVQSLTVVLHFLSNVTYVRNLQDCTFLNAT